MNECTDESVYIQTSPAIFPLHVAGDIDRSVTNIGLYIYFLPPLGVGLSWLIIPRLGWRWLCAIGGLCAVPVLFSMWFVDEPARFELSRKRYEKGRYSFIY